MPDAVLQETLRRLVTEAADRFRTLVATGDEIPFDVAEADGDNTFFYRYVPLTRRYVVERSDEVRALPSFGAACSAVAAAEVASPYLEARGLPVPADPAQRAAGMIVAFVAELWDGCSEFAVNRVRLDRALAELEAETRDLAAADVLIAPIVGLKAPTGRLELPSEVRVVPADAIEAPLEAMSSEGMERRSWEPQLLAIAELEDAEEGPDSALAQLRDLISVLRLFKEGGVGLGPYGFAPTGAGKWRRIATGAPAPRPGGYRLTEAEADELVRFAERLAARPDPDGALGWAVRRFELGCERPTPLEGLSDHLLALRSLLENDGAVGAALPVRAAALIAAPDEREEVADRIRAAFELERSLACGEPFDAGTGLGLAAWVEECLRTLLRDAALGELSRDLGNAADESLISTGLQAGDGSGAEADEWDALVEEELAEFTITATDSDSGTVEESRVAEGPPAAPERESDGHAAEGQAAASGRESEGPAEGETAAPGRESEAAQKMGSLGAPPSESEAAADEPVTRILEPIPTDTSEIRVSWVGGPAEETDGEEDGAPVAKDTPEDDFAEDPHEEGEMTERDWLSEVSREERGTTLEWPAAGRLPRRDEPDREPIETRVRHLFPVPEDADWEVRELLYDRRRAGLGR